MASDGCLQVTIEEGRFVIMSHQRAERALSGHAEMLRQELSTAADHLTDVFSRLEAGLQVSRLNQWGRCVCALASILLAWRNARNTENQADAAVSIIICIGGDFQPHFCSCT